MNTDKKIIFIIIGIGIFGLLFLIFYPPIYTIQDEANYFDFAYKLKEGTIYFDPLYAHKVIFNGKKYVDMYPPGTAILLLPFTFIHWKALFLLNPLLHIIAFLSFYKLLKFLKVAQRLSLLYLFFPAFTLYTRTLTADMAAASLITIALYLYFKKGPGRLISSGALLGAACMIKYSNFLIAVPLVLFLLLKERRKAAYIMIGFLPFIFLILSYNHIAYGGIFKTGYGYIAGGGAFNFRYLFNNLHFYIMALTVIYPLMLPLLFFYRKAQKTEIIIIPISMIAFFSLWHYVQIYPGQNFFARLTVGMRLLLPAVPLLLLAYADFLDRIFKRFKNYYGLAANLLAVLLIIIAFFISFRHQQYLDTLFRYKEIIYSNIPVGSLIVCDGETPRFLQNVWGPRKHVYLQRAKAGMDSFKKQHSNVYAAILVRFDKKIEAKRKLETIEYLDEKYGLEPVYDEKGYFNLKIYKVK